MEIDGEPYWHRGKGPRYSLRTIHAVACEVFHALLCELEVPFSLVCVPLLSRYSSCLACTSFVIEDFRRPLCRCIPAAG